MSAGDSRLEEAARRVAEQLPPLTEEQRARIAALLAPALDPKDGVGKAPEHRCAPRPDTEGRDTDSSAGTPTTCESTTARLVRAHVTEQVTR